MPYTPKQFSGRSHPLQAKGSWRSSLGGRPKDLMLWLESMDVRQSVYILPRCVHVQLQLTVNTLSVTEFCTFVIRLFARRVVVWATAEVEVHVGVLLTNDVTQ